MATTTTHRRAAGCCLPRQLAASLWARIARRRGCPAPAPADDAKARMLASVGADLAAALERIPAAYFTVAEETASDRTDRMAVLWRLVELYTAATEQERRRADAAQAELAKVRRSRLRIVSESHTLNKGVTP